MRPSRSAARKMNERAVFANHTSAAKIVAIADQIRSATVFTNQAGKARRLTCPVEAQDIVNTYGVFEPIIPFGGIYAVRAQNEADAAAIASGAGGPSAPPPGSMRPQAAHP